MNQVDYSLLNKMNIQTDAIVINQCNITSEQYFNFNGNNILWINTTDRGLSRSRNLALQRASGDICLLADDDLVYNDSYFEVISAAFQKYKGSSIIRFQIIGINKPYKTYPKKDFSVGYINAMKISSVEIAFIRKDILDKQITFDEKIGAGTVFLMGEENAFLFHCLQSKLKIHFEPSYIAGLNLGNSSWFTGYNEAYFLGKGAAFAAMGTRITSILILQYAVRKYSLYKSSISFNKAVAIMSKGKRDYNISVKKDIP